MSEFKLHKNPDIEDAKITKEEQLGSTPQSKNIRGGRGTKMVPGSLMTTIQQIKNEEARIKTEEKNELEQIDKGIDELEAAHTIFASNITTLKNKLLNSPAPDEEKRLKVMLSMAKDHLHVIEKILPIRTSKKEYDSDILKTGILKFKDYEEVRRKQMLAEIEQLQGKTSEEEVREARKKANTISQEIFELTKQEEGVTHEEGFQTKPPAPEISHQSTPAVIELADENTTPNTMKESLPQPEEQSHATANDWQDDAVAKFGKILDAKLEERPIPILTEVVENEEIISTTAEAQKPEPALSPEAKLNLTPEQKALVEKFENNVKQSEEALEDREVAAKIPKGKLEQVSLWYNKLPLKTKLGLSAGMIATGWVVGSAAAPALITAGVLMRTLGAGGMIYALRDRFEKSARAKNGGEITGKDAFLSATSAIAISAFVSVALPNIVREYAINPIVEKVGAIYDFYNPPAKPSVVNVAPLTPNLEYIATACPGDSRWSLVARALADGPYKDSFAKMGYSQQTYVIDALKNRLTSGMTEEVANTLNVGDKIDFKDIFGDKKFMEEAFSKAQGLTSAQLANIENYKLETPANTNIPTDAEFNKYEVPMDSTAPAIENNTSTHQDTLIKTIITEGGKSVPIMEHHVPVETPSNPPTETHAVTQGNILDNVDTHESSITQQAVTPESTIDQLAIDQANTYVHDKVNDVFGIKFLGLITIEDGMKNADWLNFANRTVDEVYSADPHPTEAGNYQAEARRSGMGNNRAIEKIQNLIYEEAKRVGVKWEKGETVDHFLHRVALIKTTIVDVPHGVTIQSPEITPNIKLGFDPDINPGGN